MMSRRSTGNLLVMCLTAAMTCGLSAVNAAPAKKHRPNFIVIMVDDVGYGDIGCFGGKRARTPNLDQMAKEGTRFTDFYVHPVCGVTRAAFMTGSYAMRAAEVGNKKNGHPILHPKEVTIAEVLRDAGYRTGMIGKWHLCGGRRNEYPPELMPNAQGFEYFYGAPLHNGFTRTIEGSKFRMQLMRQNRVLDQGINQQGMDQITKWYTEEAVKFIQESADKDKPFFLFVAHSMAHVVIGATEKFRSKSGGGLYGDTIEELDWSTGEILEALKETGIDDKTLVLFTSDNGPWVEDHLKGKGGNDAHYGTARPLRGSKMMTWEGGVRVPTIARWPGTVPAGSDCSEPATIMDLLPTFAKLSEARLPKLPEGSKIDGKDITPLLQGHPDAKSPHEAIYHYSYVHLQAVRSGRWKLVVPRPAKPKYTLWSARMTSAVPETSLFDLYNDIGETKNVAAEHPDIVERLMKHYEQGREDIGDYNLIGRGARFYDDGPRRTESRKWMGPSLGEVAVPRVPGPGTPQSALSPRLAVYDNAKPIGNLRFDFETGDMQGWKVVTGKFDRAISDRPSLPKWKGAPFRRQGRYHLSTAARRDGSASDGLTGVIESPHFVLKSTKMSFLVSGGNRDQVHVALCSEDGKELARTGGANSSQMIRRTLDLSDHVGATVFIRVVDRARERWGHITFDDFSCAGQIVARQDAPVAASSEGKASAVVEEAAPTVTHSFLATGSQTYIVDESGKKIWQYPHSTRDGYVLPDGNIVLTLSKTRGRNSPYPGGGVIIVDRKGKVLFQYKGQQSEVNSAQPVGDGNLVLTEAGPNPRLREIDRTGRVLVEFPLACQKANHHMQTRMARKLDDGTYLAPHLFDFAVKQYDRTGKVLQVFDTTVAGDPDRKIHTWPFTAIRLSSGSTLVNCTHGNRVVEFDRGGKIVWELTNEDLPGPWLQDPCGAQVLPNGNVVITSYAAGRRDPKAPKLIEVTRNKKVVWTFRDGQRHGIHHFQILTTRGKPVPWPVRK